MIKFQHDKRRSRHNKSGAILRSKMLPLMYWTEALYAHTAERDGDTDSCNRALAIEPSKRENASRLIINKERQRSTFSTTKSVGTRAELYWDHWKNLTSDVLGWDPEESWMTGRRNGSVTSFIFWCWGTLTKRDTAWQELLQDETGQFKNQRHKGWQRLGN